MTRNNQISIGNAMGWIAALAFGIALVLELARMKGGAAFALCVLVMVIAPARNHLRLAFLRPLPAVSPSRAESQRTTVVQE